MATICIIDTGHLKTDHSTTQLSTANRANSGNLIELKTVNFNPVAKANIDQNPVLSTFAESEVHLVSFENLGISISGVLNSDTSTDMDLIWPLVQLVRTRGYKALFYGVDRTATDTGGNTTLKRDSQLATKLANGHYDISESQTNISFSVWDGSATTSGKNLTNVYHMMVRFFDLTLTQPAGSKHITFVLKGVSTR